MPAPILKFVAMFEEDSGYGWSEIHYKQAGSENPNLATALDNFNTGILAVRRLILGRGNNVVGSRVSYPLTGEVASLGARFFLPGQADKDGAAPQLSLAIQMQNANGTKRKIIHLRGFYDNVEKDGGYDPAGDPDWGLRLALYKDALIGGAYGWKSKDAALSAGGVVNSYALGNDGRVTFTVAVNSGALPAAGTVIQVRFSRLNNGKSVLNRALLVEVQQDGTLKTVQQVAASPFTGKGRFNFRGTSFVAYNAMGSVSLGQRRAGRPLNRYPGRSQARPLA